MLNTIGFRPKALEQAEKLPSEEQILLLDCVAILSDATHPPGKRFTMETSMFLWIFASLKIVYKKTAPYHYTIASVEVVR